MKQDKSRRRGPLVRLPDRIKYTTVLTPDRRDALERYALAHGCSVAEAVRRAVDLLTGEGRGAKP
jgi:hypothetical protein